MSDALESLSTALEAGGTKLESLDGPGGASLTKVSPRSRDEAAAIVTRAGEAGVGVLPMGLGGRLAWCRPEVFDAHARRPPWLAVSTRHLDAVIAYEPGDGTLTAETGGRLDKLAEVVAEGGHRLTPDVARPERATLGGLVGAGQSGLDRARFGPLRHHLLGLRWLDGEGTEVRSGGRLVKNVTGFDLHRLFCGGRGTLGFAVEASLRLFPAPEVEHLCSAVASDPAPLLALAAELRDAEVAPDFSLLLQERGGTSDEHSTDDSKWTLWLAWSGAQPVVDAARERFDASAGSLARERFSGVEASARRAALRDLGPAPGRWPSFVVTGFASRIADSLSTLRTFARAHDWQVELYVQPELASLDVRLSAASLARPSLASELSELRAQLAAAETRLDARELPAAARAALPLVEDDVARRWMSRLAGGLDPLARFGFARTVFSGAAHSGPANPGSPDSGAGAIEPSLPATT